MKPLWIVQNNLGSTGNYETMRDYAQSANIPFLGVKIRPFTDDVPEDNTSGPVVVYGSVGMVRAASKTALRRGIFPIEDTLREWKQVFGDNCLNHDAMIFDLDFFIEDSAFGNEKFFVRSNDDDKTIIGHVTDWKTFRTDILNRQLPKNLQVVVSKPREIYREFRCWCVDGQVVAVSPYGGQGNKLDNYYWHSKMGVGDALSFAVDIARPYRPAPAYVVDVCDSEDGMKIVEFNGFNSAGFYEANIPAIMDAVNTTLTKNSS